MQTILARNVTLRVLVAALVGYLVSGLEVVAEETPAARPKRLLLLQQGPDGHAWASHEYHDGVRILAEILQRVPGLQVIVVDADEPWSGGPELLDGADGAFLYLAEGAKWLSRNPTRLAAFEKLAERKGGLVALHWGIGTKTAEPVDNFVQLFGGCHGGPDRKYKIVNTSIKLRKEHPILRGVEPSEVEDEFYYRLKFPKTGPRITPLVDVEIDGASHTVGWAWERSGGGRSAGFSGGHYHRNWKLASYRRLVSQSILWSIGHEIPQKGIPVDVPEKSIELLRPKPAEKKPRM